MKNMVFEVSIKGVVVFETTDYSKAWEFTRETAYNTKQTVTLKTIIK